MAASPEHDHGPTEPGKRGWRSALPGSRRVAVLAGVVTAGLRRRAAGDDCLEGGIDRDGEGVGTHRAGEARGDAKTVELRQSDIEQDDLRSEVGGRTESRTEQHPTSSARSWRSVTTSAGAQEDSQQY